MSASKKVLAAALLAVCGVAAAQTIDELTDLNRQAMLADARAKLEKKSDAPTAGGSAVGQPKPPGLPIPAVSSTDSGAVKRSPTAKRVDHSAPPVLVAIYGVGGVLLTELSDSGFEAKYRVGDRTPSGWTVSKIEKRLVSVTRPQKGSGFQTASLPFGVKLEEPREKEKDVVVTATGGMSLPPLPPSFQSFTK